MRSARFVFVTKLLALFAVYFITARLGLTLDAVGGFATLVWPPTGIALAAMLLMGHRYWPAIAAGAFLVNFVTGASVPVAMGMATGNTLEALLGSFLLRQIGFAPSLERLKDVLGLVFFAGIISTAVSATIGVSSLLLGSAIIVQQFGETWLAWWIGDALGALIIAPLLLVWSNRLPFRVDWRRYLAVLVPFALLVCVSIFVFYGLSWRGSRALIFAYLIFPFLIWIVLRFRQLGCVTAIFLLSLIAVWGTVIAHNAHPGPSLSDTLLMLQSFVGITAITFMVMAAIVAEREETERKEQRQSQRADLLAKQRSRLAALNQVKDEFISIASHQLRTPATAVKQYLGMLLDGYAGKLNAKQKVYAMVAYESNERHLRIINELLRVANLDANTIQLNTANCDLTKLVADIVMRQSKDFEKRRQQLLLEKPKQRVSAHVDKDFLRMVLENIIDNAGKYTPLGGTISVSLAETSGHVRLAISDNGIGIAKKDQAKIFNKFSRVDNELSRTIAGTGLGLYWAKKVIDLHGGSIKLISEPHQGSTFVIDLPTAIKPAGPRANRFEKLDYPEHNR